ncbi:MBL fold metallo-hydrolase [Candidatus Bathyarchaeota archaeon]|nr:MBL fold metallo-hydrolase [Candidatus Bathyarchaeota archaeon]
MLIDGGTENAGNTVVKYLQDLGITRIDFVVATHPHADHIGGLIKVLEEYNSTSAPVIIDCGFDTTSKVYRDFIALANERTLEHAVRGQVIILDTYVNLTVLNPQDPLEFNDPNDNSVVLRMQVYNVTFLFTGDSESKSEASILKSGLNVTSIILKVGHHGSRTATSLEFLEAVNPRVAIISVGLGNSYGHPHQETIEKLTNFGVIIYRTDLDGTIIVTTDGIHYTIITERP